MATWVRGVDFKNSTNTKRIGGIGIYGTDATTNKLYIGLGAEPWNNAGLQLTSSAINFKGNKIYHAGDKPTLSELGAAASSHTHSYLPLSGGTLTGETVFNNYLSLNAWSGYGSGKAQLWYNGTNKQLVIQPTAVTDIIVNNNKVYHAGNKPTPAEIGAAASSHTHNYAGSSSAGGAATTALTSNYLGSNTRMEYGWNGVNYFNISGTAGNAAKANDTPSTAWWHIMRFNHANSTGYYTDLAIPFNDTSLHYKRITAGSVQNGGWVKILDSLNYNSYAPTKTGTGASGTWGISITGNANTATTLANARTINGTSFNGSTNITTANWGTARTITIGSTGKSVNGSANVSWSLSEIGAAAASHSHSYLPLSGGTLTGRLTANGKISLPTTGSSWLSGKTLTNASIAITTKQTTESYHPVLAVQSSSNHVVNIGGLGDNFGFYGYKSTRTDNGTDWSFTFNASNGAVSSSGNITAPVFAGNLQGNATTATTLQNARTINGTSFNGSANITTANWGTARTLTIGSTGKSVNGSGNVSWSLAEIGAAAASHTHSNYVSTSGGQQINGDLNFTKKLRLYENSAISFMLDAGQTYLESGTLYSDKNGGVTFLTGRGIETSLNNNAYFEGINGFTKSFEILTSTSPSITLTPLTNPSDNTGGRIIFKSPDNQNVQLRHEWYDGSLMPFGLVLEKASGNAQAFNACLKVQGAVICGVNDAYIDNTNKPDARIVRGSTDNAGGLKIQMGGTNTTASFEVVNPNWSAAWFSCGNTGIRSNSYSNFSDERLKTNIEEVNYSVSDKINKIKIYNYNYLSDYDRVIPSIIKRDIKCKTTAITRLTKTDNYKISLSSKTNELYEDVPEKRWGVIAQEVEELFPELITETEELIDGEKKLVKSVDVYGLTVLTLEFAKELKAEIQSMKEKLGLE